MSPSLSLGLGNQTKLPNLPNDQMRGGGEEKDQAEFRTEARRHGGSPRSQTLFGNGIVRAILLPEDAHTALDSRRSAMELPQQGRSQMEFGNEGKVGSWIGRIKSATYDEQTFKDE